ncbi:MAG: TlyA family RNA methyltransferase, partial [Propionibacteriaceae bacterium]|nr:TlyA family RNA methyltransferase [Propionibacteriaceae bacterium]
HGQLDAALRADPRVVAVEGLNLRGLTLADVGGEPVDLVVADVSFISLKLLLRPLLAAAKPAGTALLLVKPQFEVGKCGLDSRGVVKNEGLRAEAVTGVVAAAAELGWEAVWQGESRLPGEHGNTEFFLKLRRA